VFDVSFFIFVFEIKKIESDYGMTISISNLLFN